ncbi:hypothetical protein SIN8267_02868 [Sinobacterium norvegicum]|uniref:DUF7939 domain-containing protein n=1 Tax=Sinobacterium norvegicum TaxID=1641715 RepID=A0ABM9AHN2_9GAMM|nr:BatD family protein [Sinobacterium norvegicum]CAH0992732.1 hypothetical protein SIN8267_02868 [Sinobacterium norvegicum]
MTSTRQTLVTAITTLCLLLAANSSWAKATATIDRNPVIIDDSFVLTLQSDNGGYFNDDPDLSAISQDFTILSQSQNQQISFVNGNSTKVKTWQLTLNAKTTGDFTLPSITINDEQTAPIKITVIKPSAQANGQGQREIFIQASADLNTVYVQSPFTYTVLVATALPLAGGSELTAPDFGSAFSEQLEDRRYEKIINGINYNIIERRYLVYPQTEGELEISPTILRAKVAVGRRSAFGYNQSKNVTRRSDMATVNVIGKPDSYPASDWLPAKKLVLSQQWSEDPQHISVGDSITRTIKIQAQGLTAAQLPPLFLPELTGASVYADKPVINSHKTADDIIGERIESYAIIATQVGIITLPEVTIHWWNTLTNQLETAVLAATTITVSGDTAADATTASPKPLESPQKKITTPKGLNNTADASNSRLWQVISAALAVLWLITASLCFALYRQRGRHSAVESSVKPAAEETKLLMRQLIASCVKHDATSVETALLTWAKAYWPTARLNSLNQLADFSPELQPAIEELQVSLYSTSQTPWRGDKLIAALKLCQPMSGNRRSDLDPLYPA